MNTLFNQLFDATERNIVFDPEWRSSDNCFNNIDNDSVTIESLMEGEIVSSTDPDDNRRLLIIGVKLSKDGNFFKGAMVVFEKTGGDPDTVLCFQTPVLQSPHHVYSFLEIGRDITDDDLNKVKLFRGSSMVDRDYIIKQASERHTKLLMALNKKRKPSASDIKWVRTWVSTVDENIVTSMNSTYMKALTRYQHKNR